MIIIISLYICNMGQIRTSSQIAFSKRNACIVLTTSVDKVLNSVTCSFSRKSHKTILSEANLSRHMRIK